MEDHPWGMRPAVGKVTEREEWVSVGTDGRRRVALVLRRLCLLLLGTPLHLGVAEVEAFILIPSVEIRCVCREVFTSSVHSSVELPTLGTPV